MDAFVIAARIILAAVFLVSGAAKLADLTGSRRAVADFGVPERLARLGGLMLPVIELAVSLLLVVPATAFVGAIGALGLLVLFVAGISYNLARGRHPDCHCFGQVHSAPVGWTTLVRNFVLIGLAGLAMSDRDLSYGDAAEWVSDLTSTEQLLLGIAVGLAAILAAVGWFTVRLVDGTRRLRSRLDEVGVDPDATTESRGGLPVGAAAPEFELANVNGERATLAGLRRRGRSVLLLFTDPNCGPCNELMPEVADWQSTLADELTVALISVKGVEENRYKAQSYGLEYVLVQRDKEVAEAYRFVGTPSAVVVDSEGTIATELVGGPGAIRDLVVDYSGRSIEDVSVAVEVPDPLEIGVPAPEFEAVDVNGETIRLKDFVGRQILVLFWSPDCQFCRKMLPELSALEQDQPAAKPEMVVVSRGSPAANRSQGLQGTVVIDDSLSIARSFGVTGTPMAVLIDADGRIASKLAIGAEAALQIARDGTRSSRPAIQNVR